MIIELRGGKSGLKDYLETGQKKGRDLHRDQLDQRIPLIGDLDVFEIATSMHSGDGQHYDHITLSFSENYVSDEMLLLAAHEFRNHALSAWPEDERHRVAFYAEAHRPRVVSYINSETGEQIKRLPHIHIGIGRHDLLTGRSIEPLGYLGPGSTNLKYIDAFQESFNARHGFSSPKDNPKITPENAVDVLARYTGARPDALGSFNQRKAAVEIAIQKEVLAQDIRAWDAFAKSLETYGAVSLMHKGQFNECYRVTPPGSDKAIRLSGVFFQRQFIERPTAEKLAIISEKAKSAYLEQMQPRKEPAYLAEVLHEWHTLRAREHRYLHTGSAFYKNIYKPADGAIRLKLLNDLERKNLDLSSAGTNNKNRKIASTRNRVPILPERNLDGIQRRSEMLLFGNDGLDVRNGLGREKNSAGLRPTDSPDAGSTTGTIDDATDAATVGDSILSTPPSTTTEAITDSRLIQTSGSGQRHIRQPSSVIAQVVTETRERYEQASDKERYTEIRKHLDCSQLLARLSHTHGLDPQLYVVATAKDGTPRLKAGSRLLTPNDFLTKELGLPWKEAAPILRQVYEHQINSRATKPRTQTSAPASLWREFQTYLESSKPIVAQQLKAFDAKAESRKAVLSSALKGEMETALVGLKGPDRQAMRSLMKLRAATAKAELRASIKEERMALRETIQPRQAIAWRHYLQVRAQDGDGLALVTLRKLDETARKTERSIPTITGTIILNDSEKTRREASFILKSLSHVVEKNGDITYRHLGKAVVRDEGKLLSILDENSEEAISAGLLIAREKFGSNLTLTGSHAFQKRAVEVAVAQGISVKFIDPQLEAYRQVLIKQKREGSLVGTRTQTNQPKEPWSAKRIAAPEAEASVVDQPLTEELASAAVALVKTPEELLRQQILAIDPNAKFEIADISVSKLYTGPVLTRLESVDGIGFAQRTNRGIYTLHFTASPELEGSIEIRYRAGVMEVKRTMRKEVER